MTTWIGLKVFSFSKKPLLTISYFEDYSLKNKIVSYNLQGSKTPYIAEYSEVDGGYWLYVLVEPNLLKIPVESARMELLNLLKHHNMNR